MLGYISSTRKKSCLACVKSKRRCDLGYPSCKRCSTKHLDCTYPNAAARQHQHQQVGVVVRQTTPDIVPVDEDKNDFNQNTIPVSKDQTESIIPDAQFTPEIRALDPSWLQSTSGASSSRETPFQDDLNLSLDLPPRLSETLLPQIRQIWEPTILSQSQVLFVVDKICAYIPSLALSGATPFIHERMYQGWQPQAYQDSCTIAALHMVKTPQNKAILTKTIDCKISALIASANTWTLAEHLAAVQALIVYQIIRLFDPDLDLQRLADRQNILLAIWSAHLWKRYFNELDPTDNCYDSWIFQESLRRTVLMSVFLRGIWCSFTKGGYCDQVPILAKLPVTRDGVLWSSDSEQWKERRPCTTEGGKLISYGDLSEGWSVDQEPEKLPEWERVLLVACRGAADARLLG
ncbi:hypothetical protein BU24DRAFT_340220 [Aaosphaeria arxii CBS 175.79]|uniref:Zn(2)-C6 fungal-type domain-containing protein n=1 Tax=Aaosphaeria arxii CBS 175.79 TaxID=1450172 RepID=A0A6A5Y8Q5_9PLEO|nr:uncharacterized protein BU24DRAFT_340220 [Aaosphaeria arxii CBS 175.79]KAF2021972.1 hypothetical protein BU24DRAFT_340220 [Aaosphaeria arxii CBS 175.79]